MDRKKLILPLLVLAVVMIAGCAGESPEKAEILVGEEPQATTTTQSTELILKVGETAKTSRLEVTVISTEKVDYYTYYSDILNNYNTETAPQGKKFLIAQTEIKNTGNDRTFSGSTQFSLSDSNGYRYDPEFYSGDDGLEIFQELYPGQKMGGKIVFKIPEDATGLKFSYDFGDLFSGVKLATWNLD